jgi:hypothetical protein
VPQIRDRFWMWGHVEGSHNKGWGLPSPSRMTPAEAAYYMGIPNVIMVTYDGKPVPPFDREALALSPLKQVVWSIIGDSSSNRTDKAADLQEVLRLAGKYPNITGAMMDDFFHDGGEEAGRATVDELRDFQDSLHSAERAGGATGLDLWVVLYDRQIEMDFLSHMDNCDVVTYWTWKAEDLPDLEKNFNRLVERSPNSRKVLGIYMWDYGGQALMPMERMEAQCEFGLQALKSGRIEGIIFLSNCVVDIELDAVEWTREWIASVGDTEIP